MTGLGRKGAPRLARPIRPIRDGIATGIAIVFASSPGIREKSSVKRSRELRGESAAPHFTPAPVDLVPGVALAPVLHPNPPHPTPSPYRLGF
jgi:hypothetical protein